MPATYGRETHRGWGNSRSEAWTVAAIASWVGPLLEREDEFAAAGRWCAAALGGEGRVCGIAGPAGSGKSRLLDAITAAAAADFEVLHARAQPLERELAFGLARDLLGADAAQLLTGRRPPRTSASVWNRILRLYALTEQLCRARPLLLAVDDIHAADEQSLRYLAYVGARVRQTRALVILTWNPGEPHPGLLSELVDAIGEVLTPAPLSEAAIAVLLARVRPGTERLAGSWRAATAGNAWLVSELCDQLRRAGHAGLTGGAVPPAVRARLERQLLREGGRAVALARVVAVLGSEARLGVAAAAARLTLDQAAVAAGRLVCANFLDRGPALSFTAPLVAAAIYESITPGERAILHGRVARLLRRGGAPARVIARHLLASEPLADPDTVVLLRTAATEASQRGDDELAARYLARALEEGAPVAKRPQLLTELGRLEARAGLVDAEQHLRQALGDDAGNAGGRAAVELSDLLLAGGRVAEARQLLHGELDGGKAVDQLLAARSGATLIACSLAASAPPTELQRLGASRDGATRQLLSAAGAAVAGIAGGSCALSREAALMALEGSEELAGQIGCAALIVLLRCAQAGGHGDLVERCVARGFGGDAARSPVLAAVSMVLRGGLLLERGELAGAEAHARRALSGGAAPRLPLIGGLARAVLAHALVLQGRVEAASSELGDPGCAAPGELSFVNSMLGLARGAVSTAAGKLQRGLDELLAAGRQLAGGGQLTPSFDWRSRAGLLAFRLGDGRRAVLLVDEELAGAERLGAPGPLGRALRARATLSPPAEQLELLEAAIETLRMADAKLAYADALYELGAARRRYGSRGAARGPLAEALQLAHECGAMPLARRARRELLVLGARPRRYAVAGVAALTAREREASELAAAGMTNREIAASMSVTGNTVEYHLTNAYRKLSIETRTQLAGMLGATEAEGSSLRLG